jgi:hypothetical protein
MITVSTEPENPENPENSMNFIGDGLIA